MRRLIEALGGRSPGDAARLIKMLMSLLAGESHASAQKTEQ
jgi:hypothetical protein